jgi:hypothetical protein
MKKIILSFLLIVFLQMTYAQVINKAYFIVKTGTNVFFEKTFNNETGAILDNRGNIHYNADLTNNGTMTLSANANLASGISYFDSPSYSGATINAIQYISGSSNKVVFENLTLNMTDVSSKEVVVADNMELVVEKSVTLTAGNLRLTNKAQLIQKHTGLDANSNLGGGKLLRDQQGEGNKFRYNDWSSPVYTANDGNNYTTVLAALRDGTNPASPGTITYTSGYNGTTSPLTLSTYWMYKYANLPDNSYSSWQYIGNTGAIYTGEGFLMKGTGSLSDQNYVFEGKPNDGDINLTIAAGNDYLVGNPYPSAIDANQFIADNPDTNGSLYFWEHYGGNTHNLADYQAGYATYSLGGGVLATAHPSVSSLGTATKIPERYIPVSQGFFVYSSAGGTIHFKNSQRFFVKEASGTSVFMKTPKGKGAKTTKTKELELDTRPKFRIGFDAPQIDHRQLLLTIDENTTDEFDWGYDAEIYEIFGEDMYWTIGNKKYVIQATNTISKDKEIPLGIQLSESGKISIKIDTLENVEDNIKLYIKDKLTGETYDITNQPFETNLEAGNYLDRFVLVFQPGFKTLQEVTLNEGINIFMNNITSELNIEKIADINIKSITLYNYLGQTINSWKSDINKRFVYLPIEASTGAYIVQLNTLNGTIDKKIIIK